VSAYTLLVNFLVLVLHAADRGAASCAFADRLDRLFFCRGWYALGNSPFSKVMFVLVISNINKDLLARGPISLNEIDGD
jgi:hypothetical protein